MRQKGDTMNHVYKSKISPHDKFFSTYPICDICDKYEVWAIFFPLAGRSVLADRMFFLRLLPQCGIHMEWPADKIGTVWTIFYSDKDNLLPTGWRANHTSIRILKMSLIRGANYSQRKSPLFRVVMKLTICFPLAGCCLSLISLSLSQCSYCLLNHNHPREYGRSRKNYQDISTLSLSQWPELSTH